MKKITLIFCFSLFAISLFSQSEDTATKISPAKSIWKFLVKPQYQYRLQRPFYIGATLQGVQLGYHYNKNLTFNLGYTPRNYFRKADGLELGGISEGLGFTDGANDNEIFQITGVDDYENIDKHLTMLDLRYFPIKGLSLFLSAGYGLAINSERTVFFTEATRTIGNTEYENLDLEVKVSLKDAHAFNLGLGFHHFFGPIGVGFSGVFGLNPRRLKNTEITSNQTILEADLDQLKRIVKSEVETEHFGFYQFLISFSFRFNRK